MMPALRTLPWVIAKMKAAAPTPAATRGERAEDAADDNDKQQRGAPDARSGSDSE